MQKTFQNKNTSTTAARLAFLAVSVVMIASASMVRADDGAYNTYDTGSDNTYDTGSSNTYGSGAYNTYDTGAYNTYGSGAYNTYGAGAYNTYDTGAYNTYNTSGAYNTYDTTGANNTYGTSGSSPYYASNGYVTSGGSSGSGGSFYYPGFSGGGYATSGGYSSAPVTFVYPAWGTSTQTVSSGGGSSAAVTFNYPSWGTATQYASSGGGFSSGSVSYYSGYAAPTCWLSTSPQYINPGQSATINWTSNNASSGYIPGVGTVYGNGQSVVAPSQTTQYTATFTGPGGSTNCYGTVVVNAGLVTSAIALRAGSVTLSQVPYTGLDLGPIGTILYWLGLVLLCALLAYLIAVRQVQNVLLGWLAVKMFGDQTIPTHPAYAMAEEAAQEEAPATYVRPATLAQKQASDYVDPFLLRQIFPAGN